MNYFYIIREREFIKTNENIYKIGKTTQELHKRMASYPKDSESILSLNVPDCHIFERTIINLFRGVFIQRTDIGTEYFEGDVNQMIELAYNEYRKVNGADVISYESSGNHEQPQTNFIKMNKEFISKKMHKLRRHKK